MQTSETEPGECILLFASHISPCSFKCAGPQRGWRRAAEKVRRQVMAVALSPLNQRSRSPYHCNKDIDLAHTLQLFIGKWELRSFYAMPVGTLAVIRIADSEA